MNRFFEISNGIQIPCIGFGTWQTPDGEVAINSVSNAIRSGYRHIDTAAVYNNERSVGEGIRQSGVERESLFITSKVWNADRGYDKTMFAFEKSLRDLGLEYLDLYLIHWPAVENQFENWRELNLSTWKALIELYKYGLIKAIGVSNFLPHHLEPLLETEIQPMVNQIEYHPGYMQLEAVDYCNKNHILVEAWSPLGTGKMINNPLLMEISKKYNKSVAQLCIRWCLQNGTLPLPKTVTVSRIIENFDVFDFVISEDDMQIINAMAFCGGSGNHPDFVNF